MNLDEFTFVGAMLLCIAHLAKLTLDSDAVRSHSTTLKIENNSQPVDVEEIQEEWITMGYVPPPPPPPPRSDLICTVCDGLGIVPFGNYLLKLPDCHAYVWRECFLCHGTGKLPLPSPFPSNRKF